MSSYDTSDTLLYEARRDGLVAERAEPRSVGEQIFLWLAWTLAFAFWALTMSSFFGILTILGRGVPG
jgi:hypothetical protein